MARRPRERRSVAPVAGAVAGGAVLGAVAGGLAAGIHFSRRVLTPAKAPDARVLVEEVLPPAEAGGSRRVRLRGPDAALTGSYSFIFDGGASHARLGPVLERAGDPAARGTGAERVVREIVAEDRGSLRAGAWGRITGWWYTSPAELDLGTERVSIPLEGGHGWAWLVRPDPEAAQPGRWAVHVHGRGALPEETLRGLRPLARAGVTSLVIAYRNDPGAPRGLHGRYGLGISERRDVDAAIAWAREHGAARVTLVGWSMGGTASMLAASRGPQHRMVDGVVLDSPALDWPGVLEQQARLAHAPGWVGTLSCALMQRGMIRGAVPGERRTDVASLSPEGLLAGLRVPVLIHASPEDTFVPWAGSLRAAELRPDLVTLREERGEHVKLWNVDPDGWETSTEAFVRGLPAPALD